MRRREFLGVLGGTTAWPVIASAQQAGVLPTVGYFSAGAPDLHDYLVVAFRKGLGEAGYVEAKNVAIEYRWGHNDYSRLPELAAELVRRRVNVIAVVGATPAALAAKAATTTIPVVFTTGSDPVQIGLVASLNRPGGNVTGVSAMTVETGAKRLELLNELLPNTDHFAVLVNPKNQLTNPIIANVQAASAALNKRVNVLTASTPGEIETAFAVASQTRGASLLVSPDTVFDNNRARIIALAAQHAIPAIYPFRQFTDAGGLMAYGPSFTDIARLAGVYTGRILKGEKPAELPVQQPTKYEFAINLKAARALGLNVPPTLLARADEVIE